MSYQEILDSELAGEGVRFRRLTSEGRSYTRWPPSVGCELSGVFRFHIVDLLLRVIHKLDSPYR